MYIDVRTSVLTGDVVLAIISSSVTFLLTTIFCFTIGCLCQRFMWCTKVPKRGSTDMTYPNTNQMYEEVPPREIWQKGVDLEMRENDAYISTQI